MDRHDIYDYDPDYDLLGDYDSLEDEVPGPDDICYLGHEWCYDLHTSERLADEADWAEDAERYGY
jgi:hypothetical protein